MKRPKLPQLRTPKKYRDGKLLARLVDIFEGKHQAALAIDDPASRFDALTKLEKKIETQYRRAYDAVYGTKIRQTNYGVVGSGVTGIVLMGVSLAVAPPLVPVFALGGFTTSMGGMFGSMIACDASVSRGRKSKNPLNPIASIEKLRQLLLKTRKELTLTAQVNPLPLIENPRFQKLCETTPDLAKALTQAFIKAQAEKPIAPAPAPDFTSALSKLRLSPAPHPKR